MGAAQRSRGSVLRRRDICRAREGARRRRRVSLSAPTRRATRGALPHTLSGRTEPPVAYVAGVSAKCCAVPIVRFGGPRRGSRIDRETRPSLERSSRRTIRIAPPRVRRVSPSYHRGRPVFRAAVSGAVGGRPGLGRPGRGEWGEGCRRRPARGTGRPHSKHRYRRGCRHTGGAMVGPEPKTGSRRAHWFRGAPRAVGDLAFLARRCRRFADRLELRDVSGCGRPNGPARDSGGDRLRSVRAIGQAHPAGGAAGDLARSVGASGRRCYLGRRCGSVAGARLPDDIGLLPGHCDGLALCPGPVCVDRLAVVGYARGRRVDGCLAQRCVDALAGCGARRGRRGWIPPQGDCFAHRPAVRRHGGGNHRPVQRAGSRHHCGVGAERRRGERG